MGLIRISTEGMSRAEWLEQRRKALGGSDAAAIMGMNPYSSPYTVWADKLGKLPEQEDNEAMRQGRDLEQYVADRFVEVSGKKVRRVNAILKNPELEWAHANIDRAVCGEQAGLECKTTSVFNLKKFKNGEFPDTYYCQCMHYLAVTGWDRWYLGVLVLGQGFHVFVVERDESEILALMEKERAFWTLVEEETPPPMDGSEATSKALGKLFLGDSEAYPLAFSEGFIESYLELKTQAARLEKQVEAVEQQMKLQLKDAEEGFAPGYRISWKSQSCKTFDYKQFSAEHDTLSLDDYFKTSTFRRFEVKPEKS